MALAMLVIAWAEIAVGWFIARLVMNRVRYGTFLRPWWVWSARGTEHILASYRKVEERNAALLNQLASRLAGHRTVVFGSSVQKGRFAHWRLWEQLYGQSDIDLMVEVDMPTWLSWVKLAYGDSALVDAATTQQACCAGCCVYVDGQMISGLRGYQKFSQTRIPRLEAAEQVLGISLSGLNAEVDVFLFPHEFVRGEIDISVWNDPERSFRSEVLAGTSLREIRPRRVPLKEFFPR